MEFKQLINYLNTFWTKTIAPSLDSLFKQRASDSNKVVEAVDDLNKTIQGKRNEIVNPQEISDPIVEAQKATTEAIKSIPTVKIPPADFSELTAKLVELRQAFEKKELVVNQGDTKVEVDTQSVVKAIQKLEKSLPRLEQQEVIDYTLMFDEMMKIMERDRYGLELVKIQDTLKALVEKPFGLPEDIITKDGIKVTGFPHRLGRSLAYETVWQKNVAGTRINPATEEKQNTLIAKDFATQTTLALIKAKTDNLDTALSGIKTGTDKIIAAPATEATLQKAADKVPTYDLYITYNVDGTVATKVWKLAGTSTVVKTLTYNYTSGNLTSKILS